MKVILVNQRYGHTRTIVIKGWLKGLLSLCLLGAPVALGYMGYHLAVDDSSQVYAQKTAPSWNEQLQEDQAEAQVQARNNEAELLDSLKERFARLPTPLLSSPAGDDFPFSASYGCLAGCKLFQHDFSRYDPVLSGSQCLEKADARLISDFPSFAHAGAHTRAHAGGDAWDSSDRAVAYKGPLADSAGAAVHGNGFLQELLNSGDSEQHEALSLRQVVAQLSSTAFSSEIPPGIHRHGRVIDPAAYIRRTLR